MDVDVAEHEDTRAGLVTLAILIYAIVGLVIATARLDSGEMFGLAHFGRFLGDIAAWPLVLLGLV